jgi:hypothetical protein
MGAVGAAITALGSIAADLSPPRGTLWPHYPSRSAGSGRNSGSRERANPGRAALVEQRRTDRVPADRADTVRQQQPAFVEFNRRPAVSDLGELPRILRFQNGLTAVPCVEFVRIDEIQVLIVLPGDHAQLPPILRGNKAMPLFRAAAPLKGASRNEVNSLVSINSERIASLEAC